MTDNLACPFCGGTELTEKQDAELPYGSRSDSYIGCWNCSAKGPAADSLVKAYEAWNRRTLGRAEFTPAADTVPTPPGDEPHATTETGCTCDYSFETQLWKHERNCAIYSSVGCCHVFYGTKTCVYCGWEAPKP